MKAQIKFNPNIGKAGRYQLLVKDKSIVSSNNTDYLKKLVAEQTHPKILKYKVTEVDIVVPTGFQVPDKNNNVVVTSQFSINERFAFTEQLATMVIQKKARALIVGGEGGIGKTHTIIQTLKKLGKVDCASLIPNIEDLKPIEVNDTEVEIEQKVAAEMSLFKGDYVVVKGHASAKSLYRLLWENRNRNIIFDDCDKVLQDQTAVTLLKPALDSYEDRWVSWRIEGFAADHDLPPVFKFNGSIIFITNMPMSKIDEAVKTRCYKVDVSMTFPQRIERMEAVLENVMPDIDLELKQECLQLLKDNMHKCKDINFRALMNIITIRTTVEDWKPLATFALLEH